MEWTNISEWPKAVGALLTTVGIFLAYYQLTCTTLWNKLNAGFTCFGNKLFVEREQAAATSLDGLGGNFYLQRKPFSVAVVDKFLADGKLYAAVKAVLTFHEDYAVAVRTRALEEITAFAQMAYVITPHFCIFELLILKRGDLMERSLLQAAPSSAIASRSDSNPRWSGSTRLDTLHA